MFSWFSWSQLLYVHWTQSVDTSPVDPSLSDAFGESSSKLSEPSKPPHWPTAWVCGGVCRHSITCTVLICTLTRSTLLLTASMLIISPFSTSAIGPPTNASGVTWPIMIPWDAPLKHPSVTKGTVLPRPAPTSAEPGLNISGMPGLQGGEWCIMWGKYSTTRYISRV